MDQFAVYVLNLANDIQSNVDRLYKPPVVGRKAKYNQVIDPILVANARGYVRTTVNEINGTFENGWYDACAVLLRHLMETLIYEVYRSSGRLSEIQDPKNRTRYLRLSELVSKILSDPDFDLDHHTKTVMPKIRTIGNQFAHGRRTRARRSDIEPQLFAIRVMVEDLHGLVVPNK